MSVYVDDLRACIPNRIWPYAESCHLVADGREELIKFAIRLGLKPAWFQDRAELPHFDLTKGMRYQAIRHGAIPITREQLMELIRKNRVEKQEAMLF